MSLFGDIANLSTSASQSAGGSNQGAINSAMNYSNNVADAGSWSKAFSDSWSYGATYGSEATAKSYAEALRAHSRQQEFYDQAKAYNAEQAELQRYYNALMADTTYQRSVEDMKKAGINPILAASFGLSADSVNSGAAASVSAPQTFMGNTYADQRSASQSHSESASGSWSHSEGNSVGESHGNSWGNSWQNSTSGLSTFLDQMSLTTQGLIDMIQSGQVVSDAMDWMTSGQDDGKANWEFDATGGWNNAVENIVSGAQKAIKNAISEFYSYGKNRESTRSYKWNQNVK